MLSGQAVVCLKALELLPESLHDDGRVLDIKGRALEQLGRLDEAIDCYRRVLRSGKIRESSMILLVQACVQAERFEEAAQDLQTVLESNPGVASVWHGLAVARRDVVGDRVAEHVLEGLVDRDMAPGLADHDRELDLVVELLRHDGVEDDGLVGPDHRE